MIVFPQEHIDWYIDIVDPKCITRVPLGTFVYRTALLMRVIADIEPPRGTWIIWTVTSAEYVPFGYPRLQLNPRQIRSA